MVVRVGTRMSGNAERRRARYIVNIQAQSRPPVIFGHYWFTGNPAVISPSFACVDYSAAKDGPLVAYRWDGEKETIVGQAGIGGKGWPGKQVA